MLQTIADPVTAVREMHSVLRTDGVVGIALWAKRNGPFERWGRACRLLDPEYVPLDPFDDPRAWRTCEELESASNDNGFQGVKTEEITMPFPSESAGTFVEFWFRAKNPAAEKCVKSWKGDMLKVKRVLERICQEDFEDGKQICTWAVLGVGRKV